MLGFKSVMLVVASCALAACGGGGGGGSASGPVSMLKLSSANYVAASQETLSSIFALEGSASLVTGAQVSAPNLALPFAKSLLGKLPGWVQSAPSLVNGVVLSTTEACPGGGTLFISVNDSNSNGQLDNGEQVGITASSCNFDGSLMTGTVNVTVNALSGDLTSNVYSANFTMAFSNLVTVTVAGSTGVNGTVGLVTQSTALYNNSTTLLAQHNLAVSGVLGGVNFSRTLSQYRLDEVVTPSGAGFSSSTTASGTLTSSNLGSQSVTASMLSPLVRNSTDTYPATGRVVLAGDINSQARVTVQNSSQVLIELDADGNNLFENSTVRSWSSLL